MRKIGNIELHEYSQNIYDIKYFDNRNEMENMYNPTKNIASCLVIILDYFQNDEYDTPGILDTNDYIFELRTIVGVNSRIKWHRTMYSRHGGIQFPKWWTGNKMQRITTKLEQLPSTFPHYEQYMLVFVKLMQHDNIDKLWYEYLQYLGGQSQHHFANHNLPLI